MTFARLAQPGSQLVQPKPQKIASLILGHAGAMLKAAGRAGVLAAMTSASATARSSPSDESWLRRSRATISSKRRRPALVCKSG